MRTWTADEALDDVASLLAKSIDTELGKLTRVQQILDGIRLDPSSVTDYPTTQ